MSNQINTPSNKSKRRETPKNSLFEKLPKSLLSRLTKHPTDGIGESQTLVTSMSSNRQSVSQNCLYFPTIAKMVQSKDKISVRIKNFFRFKKISHVNIIVLLQY